MESSQREFMKSTEAIRPKKKSGIKHFVKKVLGRYSTGEVEQHGTGAFRNQAPSAEYEDSHYEQVGSKFSCSNNNVQTMDSQRYTLIMHRGVTGNELRNRSNSIQRGPLPALPIRDFVNVRIPEPQDRPLEIRSEALYSSIRKLPLPAVPTPDFLVQENIRIPEPLEDNLYVSPDPMYTTTIQDFGDGQQSTIDDDPYSRITNENPQFIFRPLPLAQGSRIWNENPNFILLPAPLPQATESLTWSNSTQIGSIPAVSRDGGTKQAKPTPPPRQLKSKTAPEEIPKQTNPVPARRRLSSRVSAEEIEVFRIPNDDMTVALKDIACSRFNREMTYFDVSEAKLKLRLRHCTMADLQSISKDDFLELIRSQAKATVCIKVGFTSSNRSKFYHGINTPYPSHNTQSRDSRQGTGIVKNVIKYEKSFNIACQCPKCSNSDCPSYEWGEIEILTATHLVFDDTEAMQTSCFLDFDSPACSGEMINGFTVKASINGDGCILKCFTHDLFLTDELEKRCRLFKKSCAKLNKKFTKLRDIIVTVIHQPGQTKGVYVGENPNRFSLVNHNSAPFVNAIHVTTHYKDASVYFLEKELPECFNLKTSCEEVKQGSQNETFNGRTISRSLLFKGPGIYEMVTDSETDADLCQSCEKRKAHKSFKPIRELRLEHISLTIEDWLFKLIKSFANITVKVSLVGESETCSGTITKFERCDPFDYEGCPCFYCLYSSSTPIQWASIEVKTKATLVESVNGVLHARKGSTAIEIMLDDKKVEVFEVNTNNVLKCVTHCTEDVKQLEENVKYHETIKESLVNDLNTTVIVSHPHGSSKQVSLGQTKHQVDITGHKAAAARWRDENHWVKYLYTTPTCPGSSGAYVYKLGDEFSTRVHSGTYNFINYSGEYVALENL